MPSRSEPCLWGRSILCYYTQAASLFPPESFQARGCSFFFVSSLPRPALYISPLLAEGPALRSEPYVRAPKNARPRSIDARSLMYTPFVVKEGYRRVLPFVYTPRRVSVRARAPFTIGKYKRAQWRRRQWRL